MPPRLRTSQEDPPGGRRPSSSPSSTLSFVPSRACVELGIEPRFRQYEGNDPLQHVLSLNLQRRHLTASERAFVALEIEKYEATQAKKRQAAKGEVLALMPEVEKGKARDQAAAKVGVSGRSVDDAEKAKARMVAGGGDKKSGMENFPYPISDQGTARDAAAAKVGVSGRSVDDAEKVIKQGVPALVKMVERDEISLHKGRAIAELPKPRQQAIVELGITRDQSSHYQQLAAMPEEHFETAVATARIPFSPTRTLPRITSHVVPRCPFN